MSIFFLVKYAVFKVNGRKNINDNTIEIQFYVNDELKAKEIPPDSEILQDPTRLGFGPKRSFYVTGQGATTNKMATGVIENVEAVFKNRIQ